MNVGQLLVCLTSKDQSFFKTETLNVKIWWYDIFDDNLFVILGFHFLNVTTYLEKILSDIFYSMNCSIK